MFLKKGFFIIFGLVLLLSLFGSVMNAAVNANPTWYVDARVIYHRQLSPYDYYGAKDPSIVYYGGKYHVFYTGANQSGGWQMLYTSASTIAGLANAPRTFMSKISEAYFCAPQVFYYEPHGLWYLVYQDGTYGAAYATTTNIADPNSWSGPKSFGISGNMGWDYYIICDDSYAYMYNTPSDGSGNLYVRRTSLANFPRGWSAPTVAITDSFEGANVYKSLADGKYYLIVEDMKDGRYYELWTSSSAGGPWTKVNEKWAWRGNLVYNADKWTTNVSHGEIIRAGYNQKLEINDINKVDFLIQGTTSLSGEYQKIIWDLGIIRNYTGGSTPTPTLVGDVTRLYSYNFQTHFIRHSGVGSQASIAANVNPVADSQWKIVPGLADSGCVSFESVNYPGYFLRHRNYLVYLEKNDGSATFKADATFREVAGLKDSSWKSYQSYNFPSRYLRHQNFLLKIDVISSSSSDLDKQDATFKRQ